MALKDFIRSKVSVIAPTASLQDAAKQMYKDHVGSIIVVDKTKNIKGKPVGILTDRDIAIALGIATNLDSKKTVKDFMTKNMIMCSINDGIYETIGKMKSNGVRRLPVLDNNNNLAGVICADDVLQLLSKELTDLSSIINSETEHEKKIYKSVGPNQQLQIR